MNYCTKCESWYERAGTCNCFAALTEYVADSGSEWSPTDTDRTADSVRIVLDEPSQPMAPWWHSVTISAVPCTATAVPLSQIPGMRVFTGKTA